MDGRSVPLRAGDLIEVASGEPKGASAGGYWEHAEHAYIACRLVFLAGFPIHHLALYLAAQTVEQYLKAILLAGRPDADPRSYGHRLKDLAKAVGSPFNDAEFLEFCKILEPFEVAGRYADGHGYEGWQYSINLLAMLDAFAAECTQHLAGLNVARTREPLRAMLNQDVDGHLFMTAGSEGVRHRNRELARLLPASKRGAAGDERPKPP